MDSTAPLLGALNDFYEPEISEATEVKVVFLDPELRWSP
jgi:hypothetical protein